MHSESAGFGGPKTKSGAKSVVIERWGTDTRPFAVKLTAAAIPTATAFN